MSLPLDHTTSIQPLTLDKVFHAHQHWRNHKTDYASTGIPDDLWDMFFQLEKQGIPAPTIRQMFALNTDQYLLKQQQWLEKFFPSQKTEDNTWEATTGKDCIPSRPNTAQTTSVGKSSSPPRSYSASSPLPFAEVRIGDQPTLLSSEPLLGLPPLSTGSIPPLSSAEKIKKNKDAIAHLKSSDNNSARFLDLTTIIIECIRPDGHRLKIHTTQQTLPAIMQHFFQSEGSSLC